MPELPGQEGGAVVNEEMAMMREADRRKMCRELGKLVESLVLVGSGLFMGYVLGWRSGAIDVSQGHAVVSVLPDGTRAVTSVKENSK